MKKPQTSLVVIMCCLLLLIASAQSQQSQEQESQVLKQCDDIPCTREYDPVCASNGQTYGNPCMFGVAQCKDHSLWVLYDGECHDHRQLEEQEDCDRPCTREYLPLCGSNGVTYSNHCVFENAKCQQPELTIQYDGGCGGASLESKPLRDPCDDIRCTEEYFPVCGSDGITYGNRCYFGIAACRNPKLAIVRRGQCKPNDNTRNLRYL